MRRRHRGLRPERRCFPPLPFRIVTVVPSTGCPGTRRWIRILVDAGERGPRDDRLSALRAENPPDAAFCESCGKALPSSGSTGPRVVTEASGTKSRLATMHVLEDLRKQTKKAAGALLAVAILQAVFGAVIIMILKGNDQEVPPIVYIRSSGSPSPSSGSSSGPGRAPFPPPSPAWSSS